jgi:hypothetical protein
MGHSKEKQQDGKVDLAHGPFVIPSCEPLNSKSFYLSKRDETNVFVTFADVEEMDEREAGVSNSGDKDG